MLKQYFEVCATPDKAEISLLAAITERSVMDTQAWFHDRLLQRQRDERQKQQSQLPSHAGLTGLGGASQPMPRLPQASQSIQHRAQASSLSSKNSSTTHTCNPSPFVSRPYAWQDAACGHLGASCESGLLGADARAAIKWAFDDAKSRGNQAYAAHRYEDALNFYQQAQRVDPHNTTQMMHAVLSNMSAVHATQGNWRKSFHHAFEAVQLKQDYAKGHSRMATALMAMKLYREAQQAYHTALRLEPGNEAVMNQLRAVDAKIASVEQLVAAPAPSNWAEMADATIAPGLSTSSVGGMQQQVPALAVVSDRAVQPTQLKRGAAGDDFGASRKRQASDGMESTNHSSVSPKSGAEQLQQAGTVAFRAGEHDRAYLLLTEAVQMADEPDANLYANRSAVLCALLRFPEAIEDAERAVQISPTWSRGHSRRGNALHALCKRGEDRWEDARLAYQTALGIDPDNAVVRRALEALQAVRTASATCI